MSDLNPYEEGLALELQTAQKRIEALIAERDQYWESFVHWRKEADDRSEQLTAARRDAVEAEAYAEDLEKKRDALREDTLREAAAKLEREWPGPAANIVLTLIQKGDDHE